MTVREAAQWFRVHEDTIRRNLQRGVLPGKRVGRLWRLVRSDIENWLRTVDPGRTPALSDPTGEVHLNNRRGKPRKRRPALYRRSAPRVPAARKRRSPSRLPRPEAASKAEDACPDGSGQDPRL